LHSFRHKRMDGERGAGVTWPLKFDSGEAVCKNTFRL
jgi:hypothetical protein